MSLQYAAQHLAAKGRGPDTMLVHMAPSEVRGLQAIAMAHGGSLSINPQTGLPEAAEMIMAVYRMKLHLPKILLQRSHSSLINQT